MWWARHAAFIVEKRVHTVFWWGNINGSVRWEDVSVDEYVILKLIVKFVLWCVHRIVRTAESATFVNTVRKFRCWEIYSGWGSVGIWRGTATVDLIVLLAARNNWYYLDMLYEIRWFWLRILSKECETVFNKNCKTVREKIRCEYAVRIVKRNTHNVGNMSCIVMS